MTDDERREVAARLREPFDVLLQGGYYHASHTLFGMGLYTSSEVALRLGVCRLADLIEPEERTCRAGVFPDGAWAYVICCTECGYAIGGTWSDLGTARRMARAQHKFTNFCPNCGARVVQQ